MERVRTQILRSNADERGRTFALGGSVDRFLPRVGDCHVMTLEPGFLRGNHAHRLRRELLLIQFEDAWSLHYDQGEQTPIERREFEGSGAVWVEIDPGCAHAIRNDGESPLYLTALSDGPYDPNGPETYIRTVAEP